MAMWEMRSDILPLKGREDLDERPLAPGFDNIGVHGFGMKHRWARHLRFLVVPCNKLNPSARLKFHLADFCHLGHFEKATADEEPGPIV